MFNDLLTKRIVLFTGKGGVGRTTLSAAFAKASAKAGKRTVLCELSEESLDDAAFRSPLAALFGRRLFPATGERLEEGLLGVTLSAEEGHGIFLRDMLPAGKWVAGALRSKAVESFLRAAPSLLEMGIFNHLLSLLEAKDNRGQPLHEVVVVDMPATGHTMALTALPQILLSLISGGPIPDLVRRGQSFLNDAQKCSTLVVALPELLPVSEALDLAQGLRQTDVPIGAVLLNRVLADPFEPEERRHLDIHLMGKDCLGSLEYARLARAEEARQRLSEEALAVLEFPDLFIPAQERPVELAKRFLALGE